MGIARGSVPGNRSAASTSCELQEVDVLCMPSRRCSCGKNAGDFPFGEVCRRPAWAADGLLWLDILINFHLAYTNSKSIRIIDRPKIHMHYLKNSFYFDLLAAAPIDLVVYWVGAPTFVVAYFRLPRLLRLRDYARFIKAQRNNLRANQLRVELQWLFSLMAAIFHLAAVVYWYITQGLGDRSSIQRHHPASISGLA